ncbi:hypothetical protein GCM10023339_46440 [Alloalcanivorax gelatiniphagus]
MSVRTSGASPVDASRESTYRRWWVMPLFLGLTVVLSWGAVLQTDGDLLPHGPFLAAVVVLGLSAGRAGIADLFRRMVAWRVGARWYVVAPGLVISAHALALGVASGLGVVELNPFDLTLAVALGIVWPLVLMGGQWEEPGWLAFLLTRLQRHRAWTPLTVLAIAGTIRALWHLPLVAYGHIPWFDLVFVSVALQVILTWLYNATGGSLLIPMLCHLTSNAALALVRDNLDKGDHQAYWAVYTVAISLVALCVLVGTRGRLGFAAEEQART